MPFEKDREDVIEGRNAVTEALRAGRAIDKLYIAKGETDKTLAFLASKARAAGVVVVEADRRKLDSMSVTQAHQGVVALAAVLMALYFRTWKMSLAAVTGLLVVMVVTAGVYALSGFEVTPSAIIGFLTVLSYSLYDTVVVFDKVRENTTDLDKRTKRTFAEEVNLAVNQTLVRSINTSVVAVLPVASILFIGALLLGAGTLKDLSLALFVGIILGTIATIYIAAPMYAWLRRNEPDIRRQAKRVEDRRAAKAAPVNTAAAEA